MNRRWTWVNDEEFCFLPVNTGEFHTGEFLDLVRGGFTYFVIRSAAKNIRINAHQRRAVFR